MAKLIHILATSILLIAVSAKSPHCKPRTMENKVSCRGTIAKHITSEKDYLSKQVEGNTALEIRGSDLKYVKSVWFVGLNNITWLRISFNTELTTLANDSFGHLPNLETLDLAYNDIWSLDVVLFFPLYRLKVLNLDYNNIHILEAGLFSSQQHLKVLSLSNNKLRTLRNDVLSSLTNLEELHANSNELNFLDSRSFVSLEKLTYLNISDNHLIYLPDSVFMYQRNLRVLHFDKNNVANLNSKVFSPLTQVEILSFASNDIHKTGSPMFEPLVRLKKLDIVGCPIKCDCELKIFFQWCEERSIQTNMSCKSSSNLENKSEAVKMLNQMDCNSKDGFATRLFVIFALMFLGMLVGPFLEYFCIARNVITQWRSTESVNDYEYIESPRDPTKNNNDEVQRESQRYHSVMHVAMSMYDYLRPLPGRVFKTGAEDIERGSFAPTVPEMAAPPRPISPEYDVAA